jgi:hypothetical protein
MVTIGMLEKEIERRLGQMLEKRGCLYFKFESPGNPGVPDRIVILPSGVTIYLELKTHVGRLSNIQKWQTGRMKERGADVRVIRGWEQAQEFAKEVEGLCQGSK